jgi:hypothetical protein
MEDAMKYMMLIYGNLTREEVAALPPDEQQALYAEWGALNGTPGMTPGSELAEPAAATTVRADGAETLVTDGPFATVKEALAGWFILEVPDLDAAIEVAGRVPNVKRGGSVEIRPLVER